MRAIHRFEYQDIRYYQFGYSPYGRPSLFVYVYFIDGLLIDTGQRKMLRQIQSTLANLDVQQLFVTHHHEDHSGNIDALQKQFDCPAYASPLCCDMMKKPPPISPAQRMVWGSRPSYNELVPIKEYIETPNYRFELIAIPGHAPDMVALFEPKKKWLFSADLYINSYIGYFLDDESIAQQIDSIRKVLSLDFDRLFCSHNPHLTGGKEKLNEKLHFLEEFSEKVLREIEKGAEAKEIFNNLRFKENNFIKYLSLGHLSKLNMVRSVIRDQKKLLNK